MTLAVRLTELYCFPFAIIKYLDILDMRIRREWKYNLPSPNSLPSFSPLINYVLLNTPFTLNYFKLVIIVAHRISFL